MELMSGSGDGSGYGYGSGYVDGDGYGDGYGSGYGWTQIAEAIGGPGALWWRSDAEGKPRNGGSGDAVMGGQVQEMDGEISLCSRGFHATNRPDKWKGERWWIVRLSGDVQTDGEKSVGRRREIVAEMTAAGFVTASGK